MISVVFPQIVMDSINKNIDFFSIVLIVLAFQSIQLLIPMFEDYYNASVRDIEEKKVSNNINLEIYKKSLSVDYSNIDNPEYFSSYTWAIENYAEKSSEAFSLFNTVLSSVSVISSLVILLTTVNPLIVVLIIVGMIIRSYGFIKYNDYYVRRDEQTIKYSRKLDYYHRIFYMKEYAADLRTTRLSKILNHYFIEASSSMLKTLKDFSGDLIKWAIFSDVVYRITMILIIMIIIINIQNGSLHSVSGYITVCCLWKD